MPSMTTVPDDIRTLACKQAAARSASYWLEAWDEVYRGNGHYTPIVQHLFFQAIREKAFAIGLASN